MMSSLSVPIAPATTCCTVVAPAGGAEPVPVPVGVALMELAGDVAVEEGMMVVLFPAGELADGVGMPVLMLDMLDMLLMLPAGEEVPDAGKLIVVVDEPRVMVLCNVTVVDEAGAGAATTAAADMRMEAKATEVFIMMVFVGVRLRCGSCKVGGQEDVLRKVKRFEKNK